MHICFISSLILSPSPSPFLISQNRHLGPCCNHGSPRHVGSHRPVRALQVRSPLGGRNRPWIWYGWYAISLADVQGPKGGEGRPEGYPPGDVSSRPPCHDTLISNIQITDDWSCVTFTFQFHQHRRRMGQPASSLVVGSRQDPCRSLVSRFLSGCTMLRPSLADIDFSFPCDLALFFACSATALQSMEIACDTILSGKAKVMVAGGFDDFSEEGSYELLVYTRPIIRAYDGLGSGSGR